MTYPDSEPLGEEAVEEMIACDPEVKDCPDVVYQWTGECARCRGTGLVDLHRKKFKSVITCLACHGVGYVQRFTVRDDIPLMQDRNGRL